MTFKKGAVLLGYTDGITEARMGGEFFGEERLLSSLIAHAHLPVTEIPPLILDDVLDFCDDTLRDDAALLVVRYSP